MYQNNSFLAIIPARAGSKRLPNKNILNLNNKPLIAYSIEAGINSKYIDEVMVSSDSEEIIDISKNYGAEVPFIRPEILATDTATSLDVVKHTILFYRNRLKLSFDYLVLLQPTSPLREASDIDSAIEFLMDKKADCVVSVCEAEHSPLWMNTLSDNLSMDDFIPKELENKRSQDLKKFYRINGAIYIVKVDKFLSKNSLFLKKNSYAFIMDREKSIDIDEEIDFKLAKVLLDEKSNFNTK